MWHALLLQIVKRAVAHVYVLRRGSRRAGPAPVRSTAVAGQIGGSAARVGGCAEESGGRPAAGTGVGLGAVVAGGGKGVACARKEVGVGGGWYIDAGCAGRGGGGVGGDGGILCGAEEGEFAR